jgi:hypothetical protein
VKHAAPVSRGAMPERDLRVSPGSRPALTSAQGEKRDGNLSTSAHDEERVHASVTCHDCEHPVVGILYALGRYNYRCADCVPPHVRARPPVECEGCGRLLVQVSRDARFCHVVCSPDCQREERRTLRHVRNEPRRCLGCGETFTPKRRDAMTCSGRCRMRALRDRRRRASA